MISGKRLDNLIDHYIGPGELFEDTRKALRELREIRREPVLEYRYRAIEVYAKQAGLPVEKIEKMLSREHPNVVVKEAVRWIARTLEAEDLLRRLEVSLTEEELITLERDAKIFLVRDDIIS